MFGGPRRRRPPVQPLTKETANPNAATAAASAFMRREHAPALSSAAAAAALKARPTTPTNVAQVQTKRSHRRSQSLSSNISRDGTAPRGLQRSPSVASMTERTFRSPSPARSLPSRDTVPPVPSIPVDKHSQTRPQANGDGPAKAHSLQVQPFRTASQKLNDGGQGSSWFGAAVAGDPANVRADALGRQAQQHTSQERPGSTSPSINFSYPRVSMDSPGTRLRSSSLSTTADDALVYDANSRRMVPRAELMTRSLSVRELPEKVPRKKKRHEMSASGSHLSQGTMGRTKIHALAKNPPTSEVVHDPEPESTSADAHLDQAQHVAPAGEHHALLATPPARAESAISNGASPQLQAAEEHDVHAPTSAVVGESVRGQQSHATREPPEPEFGEGRAKQHHVESVPLPVAPAADSVPAQSTAAAEPPAGPVKPDAPAARTKPAVVESRHAKEDPTVSDRSARIHSLSPARTTHFAPAADQLVVRHEPPPRSLSPRKSAMKQTSPARATSPSDDGSEASCLGAVKGDQTAARKKSVRVSFDDKSNMIIGESDNVVGTDSPAIPSPQSKKPWHSIVSRIHKKDQASLDEEETMSPRPALPLFGSVREKKPRDTEERPLVRPQERTRSPPPSARSLRQPEPKDAADASIGPSSDAAIGAALSQDFSSRNEANISKYREPLPPVVTSVEGSGNYSDDLLSSEDESEAEASVEAHEQLEAHEEKPGDRAESADNAPGNCTPGVQSLVENEAPVTEDDKQPAYDTPPTISISQPSPLPLAEKEPSPTATYFGLPGSFPEDEDVAQDNVGLPNPGADPRSSPTGPIATELAAETDGPLTPARKTSCAVGVVSTPPMEDIQEEEGETDRNSVYSDAYEDLSEADDGFISLDAVLSTPVKQKATRKLEGKLLAETKRDGGGKDAATPENAGAETPNTQDDWGRAKAYWRSLSPDKRRQLEKEAADEAAEEASAEQARKPSKKATKKTVNGSAGSPKEARPHPNRNYQIQPGTKWNDPSGNLLDKNVQGSGGMRKSLRSSDASAAPSGNGGMRKSLRASSPPSGEGLHGAVVSKKPRPASYQHSSTADAARNHKRSFSADGLSAPNGFRATPRRRGSDSSESSFTRAKPFSGDGITFRKTLRSGADFRESPAGAAKVGSSRFSLRSLSPAGSAFGRSHTADSQPTLGMGNGRMRQSMRSGGGGGSASQRRKSGFGLSRGGKTRWERRGAGDSSDEEEVRLAGFSSRFDDSSDEENFATSKGKGKPSRNASSSSAAARAMGVTVPPRPESPPLPEEMEMSLPTGGVITNDGVGGGRAGNTLRRSRSGRGTLVSPPPGTMDTDRLGESRPERTRRGSFMSSILRRKKDSNKIGRELSESAARRDTKLERSASQLEVMRSGSYSRHQKHGVTAWPLPDEKDGGRQDKDNVGQPERPATAAAGASPRVGLLNRRTASYGVSSEGPPHADGPADPRRKKKFGALRRMFKLND